MSIDALDEPRLRRLIEAGRALVSVLDAERLLRQLLEVARELTGARYAALGILDPKRDGLERFETVGIDEQTHRAIGALPHGHGVLGVLIDDPRPLRLEHVGQHPLSYGFPPEHPPMDSFLGVPILIRGEGWGNLYLTEKDSGPFTEADESAVVMLAGWAGVAIENARLYEGAEHRRRDLERAVIGLEATTEVAMAVSRESDLRRVLELIVKRGRALVSARTVVLLLADGDELAVAATAGVVNRDARGRRIPIAGSSSGDVMRTRRSLRLADATELHVPPALLGVEARTALLVPAGYRDTTIGVLAAFDRLEDGPEFKPEDERLMESFAASAGTAVRGARSVAEDRLRQSIEAAEHERGRWARELHDETLQGFGALRLLLTAAVANGSPDALESAANVAVEQIDEEIRKLRALLTDLRPAALDDLGLGPAIEGLAERMSSNEALEVRTEVALGGRLDAELESGVYRLVQESLTNVAKHARATHAAVSVREADGAIAIEVRDDGDGFDPEEPAPGFGLLGMRERAALLHGTLEIESTPGAGTTVRVELPTTVAATAR